MASAAGQYFRLMVKSPKGESIKLDPLPKDVTLLQVMNHLHTVTGIPLAQQTLGTTVPPRRTIKPNADVSAPLLWNSPLSAFGVKSGDVLQLKADSTAEAALAQQKSIEAETEPKSAPQPDAKQQSTAGTAAAAKSTAAAASASDDDRVMLRRAVPNDNSCLFHAVALACESHLPKSQRSAAADLRQVIVMLVDSAPAVWTSAVLGKSPAEYKTYIADPTKWGGGIELAMLSQYYEMEIAAIDIETSHLYTYGEGKRYKKRAYLVYTGIHYDVLASARVPNAADQKSKSPPVGTLLDSDITQFSPDDALVTAQVMSLAMQWKQDKQFVNVKNFSLKCSDCFAGFVGAYEATDHMKQTGHRNFEEYK